MHEPYHFFTHLIRTQTTIPSDMIESCHAFTLVARHTVLTGIKSFQSSLHYRACSSSSNPRPPPSNRHTAHTAHKLKHKAAHSHNHNAKPLLYTQRHIHANLPCPCPRVRSRKHTHAQKKARATLDVWASSTSLTICESVVSVPTCVALISREPFWLMEPAITVLPGFLVTGMASPGQI